MSLSSIMTKVRELAEDLASQGFEHFGTYLIKRSRPNLDQFIEFQPGHGAQEGKFTCNMAWKFPFPEVPVENTFHRANRLTGTWFPHEPKQALDESYSRVFRIIERYAIPFLDSIDSIEKMVRKYEEALANRLEIVPTADSPLFFFGRDEGWKHFLLGLCYRHLGQLEKARSQLKQVIEEHSACPHEWVARRKAAAEQTLAEL